MLYNKNLFREYPDSMSLADVAHALGVSTKTASNMIRRATSTPSKRDANTASPRPR